MYKTPMEAVDEAYAVAILTDWDEFKTYDWEIFTNMYKPAFVSDGRNIFDFKKLTEIAFQINGIGKSKTDPIIKKKF